MAKVRSVHESSMQARLIVFDVDGTLYDQRRLRRRMALELLKHLAWSPAGRRKIRILQVFRRTRETLAEQEAENITMRQYEDPAGELGISADEVRAVSQEWIDQRPLPFLAKCAEPGVAEFFLGLRRAGRMIAVLSDYPALDKLDAMKLSADLVVSASDPGVGRLKPHPRGLEVLLERSQVSPADALFIGDRLERDGLCARRCEVPFLLKAGRQAGSIEGFGSYYELAAAFFGNDETAVRGDLH